MVQICTEFRYIGGLDNRVVTAWYNNNIDFLTYESSIFYHRDRSPMSILLEGANLQPRREREGCLDVTAGWHVLCAAVAPLNFYDLSFFRVCSYVRKAASDWLPRSGQCTSRKPFRRRSSFRSLLLFLCIRMSLVPYKTHSSYVLLFGALSHGIAAWYTTLYIQTTPISICTHITPYVRSSDCWRRWLDLAQDRRSRTREEKPMEVRTLVDQNYENTNYI